MKNRTVLRLLGTRPLRRIGTRRSAVLRFVCALALATWFAPGCRSQPESERAESCRQSHLQCLRACQGGLPTLERGPDRGLREPFASNESVIRCQARCEDNFQRCNAH